MFDAHKDSVFLEVPCGHCGQCAQRKMDDIYLRTLSEYQNTVDHHGYVFFQTFTFREDAIPTFHGLKCFDRKIVYNFLQWLKNEMRRRKLRQDGDIFKYILVSEYGSNTARSHHHALFFIAGNSVDPRTFMELTDKYWIHGFTATNNPYDQEYYNNPEACIVADRSACIKYVAKYVSKDFDFLEVLNRQRPAEFIDYLYKCWYESQEFDEDVSFEQFRNSYPLPEYIDYSFIYKVFPRSEYHRFMPFNMLSNHFGEELIATLSVDQLMSGYVEVDDKILGKRTMKIPRYIDYKVFYDFDGKVYTLNKDGVDMKVLRYNHNVDYVSRMYQDLIMNWQHGMSSSFQDQVVKSVSCIVRKYYPEISVCHPDDVFDSLQYIIGDNSMSDVVIYDYNYRHKLKYRFEVGDYRQMLESVSLDLDEDQVLGCYNDGDMITDPPFDVALDIIKEILAVVGASNQAKYIATKRANASMNMYKFDYYGKY